MSKFKCTKYVLFILTTLGMICSCSRGSQDVKIERNPIINRYVLILDNSKSMDSLSKVKIMEEVSYAFERLEESDELRIFVANKGAKNSPIFQWKFEPPKRYSEEKQFNSNVIPSKFDELKKAINGVFQVDTIGTYLIHSLQAVYSNMQLAEIADRNFIIVISDMLECSMDYGCAVSKFDLVNMTERVDTSNSLDEYKLEKFVKIENIAFKIISVNNAKQYKELTCSIECKLFWDTVFKKFGYKHAPHFATDIRSVY